MALMNWVMITCLFFTMRQLTYFRKLSLSALSTSYSTLGLRLIGLSGYAPTSSQLYNW